MNNTPDKRGRATLRSFRADDDVWLPAAAVAAQRDESMAQVLRRALREYAAANQDVRNGHRA